MPTRLPSTITVAPLGRDSIVSEAVSGDPVSEGAGGRAAGGAVVRARVSVSVDAGCEGVMTTRRSTVE